MVEQNTRFALNLADRILIMRRGLVVHEAPADRIDPAELANQLGIGRILGAGRAPAKKKAAVRRAPAKKTTVKKAAARKAAVKKPVAKKPAAKRPAAKRPAKKAR